MILYTPLWNTLAKKGYTTYTLRQVWGLGGGTVQRLQKNLSVSTNTLDDLCRLLVCDLADIVQYIPDEQRKDTP